MLKCTSPQETREPNINKIYKSDRTIGENTVDWILKTNVGVEI